MAIKRNKGQDVYLAGQVGQGLEKTLPIGPKRLGQFSSPGIEPSTLTESGIQGRVNQDRAFVAQPLFPDHGVGSDCWFCAGVLDGLGLYGEALSDYTVGALVRNLRRHPLRTSKPKLALKEVIVLNSGACAQDHSPSLSVASFKGIL